MDGLAIDGTIILRVKLPAPKAIFFYPNTGGRIQLRWESRSCLSDILNLLISKKMWTNLIGMDTEFLISIYSYQFSYFNL